ncbi:uncharacterized protein LOC113233666 [Hyposmocoma kahamanoa]|uniref:uncharacterized protein LOC113233666 n=1 Tax=Hyposmocoma kahamanoa TaxID=1477025 RepID=UPI000E6D72C4|nr:uncharacterized protein LOC113233666 [Hyposmocoma kahamanoa]
MAYSKKSVYFSLLIVFELVSAKININVECGRNARDVKVTHSGTHARIVKDAELGLFGIREDQIIRHYAPEISIDDLIDADIFLPISYNNQTLCDQFAQNNLCPVYTIFEVKSAEVMEITSEPSIVHVQDFENKFSNKIKVSTGINQSVQTSVTRSWTNSTGTEYTRDIKCGLEIKFFSLSGGKTYSYTSSFGESFEKTETVTIGSTSDVEIELNPGQACSAVLTANRGYINIKVTYIAHLNGTVIVYSNVLPVDDLFKTAEKVNEKTFIEIIKIGYYTNASLKVYDKLSGAVMN